jgi:hypothetical protein
MAPLIEVAWYEFDHKRVPKGRSEGGEFADKFGNPKSKYMEFANKSLGKAIGLDKEQEKTKATEAKAKEAATHTKIKPPAGAKTKGHVLHNAFVDLIGMPYFRNQAAKSGDYVPGHEEAVGKVMEKNGFKQLHANEYKFNKNQVKKWMDDNDQGPINEALVDMPNGTFFIQPLGSQQFPDLLIKSHAGKLIALECKSSKDGKPMWNDNLPKLNAYYIMTSEKHNGSTMFRGKDVITPEELEFAKAETELMKARAAKFNALAKKKDVHNRGWIIYPRQQFNQAGPGSSTNFFLHKEKTVCEKNVLKDALKL